MPPGKLFHVIKFYNVVTVHVPFRLYRQFKWRETGKGVGGTSHCVDIVLHLNE
jgi:hypothetical protein